MGSHQIQYLLRVDQLPEIIADFLSRKHGAVVEPHSVFLQFGDVAKPVAPKSNTLEEKFEAELLRHVVDVERFVEFSDSSRPIVVRRPRGDAMLNMVILANCYKVVSGSSISPIYLGRWLRQRIRTERLKGLKVRRTANEKIWELDAGRINQYLDTLCQARDRQELKMHS